MNLSSSLEDYLEAIYNLQDEEGRSRITDISIELNVEKPSVNTAIKKLKNLNLVIHEKYGDIILTKRGIEEASRIKVKHDTILKFLNDILGIPRKEAERDACKIEHVISNNSFFRLSKFVDFIDESIILDKKDWLATFEGYINAKDKEDPQE